jgi:AraC-like DNA-binding protein
MAPLGYTSPNDSPLPFAGEPTTTGAYTQAIARALEFKGVESVALFRAAGLAEHYGTDPLQRVPVSRMNALFALCVAATGDPYFGLIVGDVLQVASLHALGQSLATSNTLMDFGERLARYFRLLSEVATMRLDVGNEHVALVTSDVVATSAETQDAWLAFLVRFVRQLTRDAVNPLRVDFIHPLPAEGPGPYEHYFRCPVRFSQRDNVLVFDRALFDRPLESSSPELAVVNDQIVADYIGRLDRSDVVTHVRLQIIARLDTESCDRDTIARDLGMAPATLARRLMQRGSSFQDILNGTRRDLALVYLQQAHLPVTEVAFRLGFTDLSNFTRAFKRWTGQSPSEFRASAAA